MSFTEYTKGRPGAFVNFVVQAKRRVEGSDGVVILVAKNYNVTATADTIYEFTSETEAQAVIGVSKMAAITRIFQGGANKVIVYTQAADAVDYAEAQAALELQIFEALTFDHALTTADVSAWKTWLNSQEENDTRREMFYGVESDTDVAAGIARSVTDNSPFIVNHINAPVFSDETLTSADIAPFVAGAWAATPISQSITFLEVPDAIDVNVRLTAAQVREAVAKGAIAFEYTGQKVRLISGRTTAGTSLKREAVKHTVARDWKFLIEEKYIGKVPNGPNQRLSMEADLKDYLRTLEAQGVIEDSSWYVNVTAGPATNQVIVNAFVRDLETMEDVYITVGLGA